MKHAIKLNFPNGWTASIAPDTDPACWTIMAWPTRQDNRSWECVRFHVWADEKTDVRLWSIDDLIKRLVEITNAEPPP